MMIFSIWCKNIEYNLFRLKKRYKIHLKNRITVWPRCKSCPIVKNGIYGRKLIFLRIRGQNYIIKKNKCKKCDKFFYSYLSLIYPNSNIISPVIDCIENLYQIYGTRLHKIRFDLKQQHNIEISHQSIENIILKSKYEFDYGNWYYSRYYLFDNLSARIIEWSIFWIYSMLN